MYDDDCLCYLCLSEEFWNGAKGEVMRLFQSRKCSSCPVRRGSGRTVPDSLTTSSLACDEETDGRSDVVCFYPLSIDAFCMCSFFEDIEKQIYVVDLTDHYSGFG